MTAHTQFSHLPVAEQNRHVIAHLTPNCGVKPTVYTCARRLPNLHMSVYLRLNALASQRQPMKWPITNWLRHKTK